MNTLRRLWLSLSEPTRTGLTVLAGACALECLRQASASRLLEWHDGTAAYQWVGRLAYGLGCYACYCFGEAAGLRRR